MNKFKPHYGYFALGLFNIGIGAALGTWANIFAGILFIIISIAVYIISRHDQARRKRRELMFVRYDRIAENYVRAARGFTLLPEIPLEATITRKELKSSYNID